MNLYWIMGLAVYVLGEKILPAGTGSADSPGLGWWLGALV